MKIESIGRDMQLVLGDRQNVWIETDITMLVSRSWI